MLNGVALLRRIRLRLHRVPVAVVIPVAVASGGHRSLRCMRRHCRSGFGMFKASMPSLAHFPVLLETFRILPKRRYHSIEVFIAELGKVITCVGFLDFLQ